MASAPAFSRAVQRCFDTMVAGPSNQLDMVHARGLVEMQFLESEGVNEHSLVALTSIADEMESKLDALHAAADALYGIFRTTPVGEGQAVLEVPDTYKVEIGGLGVQTTPLSMLALAEELVAAHVEDVVAKRMILNDMSYSTTADVLLTYRVWWKTRASITGNALLVKDAIVLEQALERGKKASLLEAQRMATPSPAGFAARRRKAATPQ